MRFTLTARYTHVWGKGRLIWLIIFVVLFSLSEDLTRSNMGSSSDSEKIIQRLNDELRDVQELANTEKHKCMELQGRKTRNL